jgi:tetratricopeptide (TPR) repeat protein
VGVTLVFGACVTVPPKPELVGPHQVRARSLERDGMLRPALLEWKIARTIDPDDANAKKQEARLEARIKTLVAERLAQARTSLQRNAHLEARRKLLSVLALDPANAQAVELLRSQVADVEFVTHTVRAGDTLALLAERYYGDSARGEVIWETNRLPPGRALRAGAVLKIPEIPGVPFYVPGRKAPPTPPPSDGTARVPPERGETRQEEPPEVNPTLADVREAVDRKEFKEALSDLDKYLTENPRDREGTDLKKHVLYRQAQFQLEQKHYDDSYRTLIQLARIQPDYQDVTKLLQQARKQVIDHHYQEGIRLFREERLKDAIAQWRLVLEMEPRHENAKRNIDQAEKLLEGLERRKTR